MMTRNRGIFQLGVFLLGFLLLVASGSMNGHAAEGKSKKSSSRQSNAGSAVQRMNVENARRVAANQAQAASKIKDAAENRAKEYKAKIQEADKRAQAILKEIKTLETQVDATARQLAQTELQLEQELGATSTLGENRIAAEAAAARLDAERRRVLESPDYESRYQAAVDAGDAEKMLAVRNQALAADEPYQRALASYKVAKSEYEQVRSGLFRQNSDWVATVKAAREAEHALADAKNRLTGALSTRARARQGERGAISTATAAQQAEKMSRAAVDRLSRTQKQQSGSKRNKKQRRRKN